MLSSRSSTALLAGAFIAALAVGSAGSVQALPLPVSSAALAGDKSVNQVADRSDSDADRFDGRRAHRGLYRDRAAGASSPSGCEPRADPDSMGYCGYHINKQ